MEKIPLMFCFDNNYAMPASVAFLSLIEHADMNYFYEFNVVHSDITLENQRMLNETISNFSNNCSVIFIDMNNKYDDLWKKLKSKGHFSKEMIYKLIAPSLFEKYDKVIISDVDVVFLGDIAPSYIDFDINEDIYMAGVKPVGKILKYMENYKEKFSEEEINKMSNLSAGYLVYNLKKMREDDIERLLVEYFEKNCHRLNQPEQDTFNYICYPKFKFLNLSYVTCNYMWDLYLTNNDFEEDKVYSSKQLRFAMNNPIQLHYATKYKPWKRVNCSKGEEWFKYITRTPFLKQFLSTLPEKIILNEEIINLVSNYDPYEKRITKYVRYIKKNPNFLFKKEFYEKINNKITNKIKGEKNE